MGLRGPGSKGRRKASVAKTKRWPWQKKGLSRVQRVTTFLEYLPVTKGPLAGKKMQLLPGQLRFVEAVYGRLNPEGLRTVRLAVKSEPRGGGKTGLLAGLALCHLLGPEAEARGEIYSAAIDKLQAGIIFREMKAIIEAIPEFALQVNIQRFHKIIEVLEGPGAGSIYESLSADERRAHGLAPSLWIYDEFAQAKNRELLDNLMTAMGKRKEALGIIISTQAADDLHPLSQIIDDGLKGEDPGTYIQLAFAPKDADPFAEATWYGCNEALGKFLDLEDLRSQARRAKRTPSFLAAFRNLRLNQRVTVSNEPWIGEGPVVKSLTDLSLDDFAGRECYLAVDLSGKHDLTAVAAVFPDDKGGADCFLNYWTPRDTMREREDRDRVRYTEWSDNKFIEAVPGSSIDYAYVARFLAGAVGNFSVLELAFDRWRIGDLKREMDEAGIENFIDDGKEDHAGLKMVPVGQGFRDFSPALDVLETSLMNGVLRIQNNPVTKNHAASVTVEMDAAGNRKFTKKKSYGRIDGMVALAMGVKRALGKNVQELSIYEHMARARAKDAAEKAVVEKAATAVRAGSSIYEHLAAKRRQQPKDSWGGVWHDDD